MVFAWSRPPKSPRPLTQTALHEASLVFPEGASPSMGAMLPASFQHCSRIVIRIAHACRFIITTPSITRVT